MDFICCRYGRLFWYLVCIYFYVCTVEAAFQEADDGDAGAQVQPRNENQEQLPEPAGGVDGMRASPSIQRALILPRQALDIWISLLRLLQHLASSVGLLLRVAGRRRVQLFRRLLFAVPVQYLLLAGISLCFFLVVLLWKTMGFDGADYRVSGGRCNMVWGALLIGDLERQMRFIPEPPPTEENRPIRRIQYTCLGRERRF